MASLAEFISRADEAYHNDADPVASDAAYDATRLRLEALEALHPAMIREDSPIGAVGAKPAAWSALPQVEHAVPMRSLGNCFDDDDVRAFVARVTRALGPPERSDDDARAPLRFCAEPKIDGASASLRYVDGVLVVAASRGDGEVGEDVTRQIGGIPGAPTTLTGRAGDWPATLEIRGEVFIADDDFAALNARREARGMPTFKSARNAAAGAMRRLEPPSRDGADAGRYLRFLAYGWGEVKPQTELLPWSSQRAFLASLPALGLSPVPTLGPVTDDVAALVAGSHAALERDRASIGYRVDGVVYKVDDVASQRILGADSRAPRWATAHKFAAETAVTTLRAVDVQVGRTGALTPVATLDPPVALGGATVTRATLHNFEDVARKGLRLGARVVVERAGDVIPRVVRVVAEGEEEGAVVATPTRCPACGSAVSKTPLAASVKRPKKRLSSPYESGDAASSSFAAIDDESEDATSSSSSSSSSSSAAVLRCTGGWRCPAQALERVAHFASRDALDVRGLARKQIAELLDAGVIASPADLFTMRARFEHLGVDPDASGEDDDARGDGGGVAVPEFWTYASGKDEGKLKRSAKKLFDALDETAAGVPLHRFIYSLGIPQVGLTTAKLLSRKYRTLDAFRDAAEEAAAAKAAASADAAASTEAPAMTDIDGIGPVVAATICEFWSERANVNVVDDMLRNGVVVSDDASPPDASDASDASNAAAASATGPLTGYAVVVTGAVPGMTREEAFDAVAAAGGSPQKAVSGKTHVLVVGEGAGRRKAEAAEARGVAVIDAEAFLRVLAGEEPPPPR